MKLDKSNYNSVLTYFQGYVWEVVKVGRVVDGTHLNRYGRRPFANVLPIDSSEERHQFQILDATLRTQSGMVIQDIIL